ncbi:MAG TPA: DUF2804 domain-containing protein [Myxococcota bacterium]|nr:DUF2804 domain-containing protein [Myxococcota bacterium]
MGRVVEEAPDRLVNGGKILSGVFRTPVRDVNILDAMAAEGTFARALLKMRMKEWCGIGFVHPDWYLSVMIQDAKYVSSGMVYLWDRNRLKYFRHGWSAAGTAVSLAANQYDGECSAKRRGFSLEFEHRLDRGLHHIRIDVAATRSAPAVKAELRLHEDLSTVTPLVASLHIDSRHHAYTHKAPMGIEGWMTVGDTRVIFEPDRDTANMDEHKAIYPYRTHWLWGSFAGRDSQGRLFGVNLADHVFADQETNNENCVWLGGDIRLPGRIEYQMDPSRPFDVWRIDDRTGTVDLQFHPAGRFVQKANLLVAGIDYYQMFGSWRGVVQGPDGMMHDVPGLFGVAERMDTRF